MHAPVFCQLNAGLIVADCRTPSPAAHTPCHQCAVHGNACTCNLLCSAGQAAAAHVSNKPCWTPSEDMSSVLDNLGPAGTLANNDQTSRDTDASQRRPAQIPCTGFARLVSDTKKHADVSVPMPPFTHGAEELGHNDVAPVMSAPAASQTKSAACVFLLQHLDCVRYTALHICSSIVLTI